MNFDLRHFRFFQMPSGSFFEQLTNNGSLSPVVMGTTAIVLLVLTYLIASRFFFASKSKSKSSKQQINKSKETNKKQQQQSNESSSGKKKNKGKKNNAAATPSSTVKATAVSSSSSSSQSSEESEEEEKVLRPPAAPATTKKATPAKKATPTTEETPKTNGGKSTGNEQVEQGQNADAKKKRGKPTVAPAPQAKAQVTTGKTGPSNANVSGKKAAVVAPVETEKDDENVVEQEDEGQWVTQGGKQVNNRNRNKGKNETTTNAQETTKSAPVANEKRSTGQTNKIEDKIDVQVESAAPVVAPTPAAPEPIEICQLLPSKENPYTASDDWWKRALNKPQTFSVDDIGEWPERDQDEQYVVNVRQIIPTRPLKSALTEKDINVNTDVHDDVNQNGQKRLGKTLLFLLFVFVTKTFSLPLV